MKGKTIIAALLAVISSLYATRAQAQETTESEEGSGIEIGYNSLEIGVSNEGDARTRAITNVGLELGWLEFGYHGLNAGNSTEEGDTYFGRHRVVVGPKDSRMKFVFETKTDQNGLLTSTAGVRTTYGGPDCEGGGFLDTTVNGNHLDITSGVGIGDIIGGVSLGLAYSITIPREGDPSAYLEVDLSKKVAEHFSLFGRTEIAGPNEPTHLVGLRLE